MLFAPVKHLLVVDVETADAVALVEGTQNERGAVRCPHAAADRLIKLPNLLEKGTSLSGRKSVKLYLSESASRCGGITYLGVPKSRMFVLRASHDESIIGAPRYVAHPLFVVRQSKNLDESLGVPDRDSLPAPTRGQSCPVMRELYLPDLAEVTQLQGDFAGEIASIAEVIGIEGGR